MTKTIAIIAVSLLFSVQLFIPVHLIYQQEHTLKTGTTYKFKTEPIDPSDPFRGKYITLNFELDSFQTEEEDWPYNSEIYIYLKRDDNGFAAIKNVSKTRVATNDDYIKATALNHYNGRLNFKLPFDRFYMNEYKAYDAELAVRQSQIDTTTTCYALISVKAATAVLNNVYIDTLPIQQFVDELQEKDTLKQ